jgi:H+-transporting ATPase
VRAQYGPNEIPQERPGAVRVLLQKFWAPVPWMLEATIVLQLVLGKADEAMIIAVLLLVNALVSFVQERRANNALALLQSRLAVQARVLRDSRWQLVPAQELVPGDVLHVRMGDMAPADVRVLEGQVLLDQAALTGESLPVEASVGAPAYAGTTIKRGEATGVVTATGQHTAFGTMAALVRTARATSHLERVILTIVKYLVVLDTCLVFVLLVYTLGTGMPLAEMLPFALILLVASVPVALPATFTLATALGALELAQCGVLVTRLAAIEEAAAMDILASDKTGTLTQNRLVLAAVCAYAPLTEDEVLRLAALARDDATQDPIDLAILSAARTRHLLGTMPQRVQFLPFDPATKRSEGVFVQGGQPLRVLKGAPQAIAPLVQGTPDVSADVDRLASNGSRLLAIAVGPDSALRLAGLVALKDPPRDDARTLVHSLHEVGVRVVMITGDSLATARSVATQVGIGDRACPPGALCGNVEQRVREYDVFAGVFPEDKFHLVQALQRAGHVVGMTGDGVNDAPALKQAEVGIAVANATDVAKAAASLVLTSPGLRDVLAAVETSRRIYQRMLTYTLNKIIKTIEIAVFLSLGVMLTGVLVITPLLIVLLLFTNDFVTMAIATDRVTFARTPERWRIPTLILTAGTLATPIVLLSFTVFFVGRDLLHLPLAQVHTLIFVLLVFTGQGNVYLVRARRHCWQSLPSRWLLLSSVLDVVMVSVLATQGILMAALSPALVAALFGVVLAFLLGLDVLKIRLFRYFDLH